MTIIFLVCFLLYLILKDLEIEFQRLTLTLKLYKMLNPKVMKNYLQRESRVLYKNSDYLRTIKILFRIRRYVV